MADDGVLFELRAKIDDLERDLNQAKAKLAEVKAEGDKADESGLGFKKSVSGVRSWVAAVGGAIGVATSFYLIGQRIRETWDTFFETGTDKADKFINAIGGQSPQERIKKTTDEIQRLQTILGASNESTYDAIRNRIAEGSVASIEERLKALNAELDSANAAKLKQQGDAEDKANAETARKERERQAQLGDDIRKRVRSVAEESLTEEEKIQADRLNGLEELQRFRDSLSESDREANAALLTEWEAGVNRVFDVRMKKLRDEADEQRRLDQKRAEDLADAMAKELGDAMDKVFADVARQNQAFFAQFSGRQNELLGRVVRDLQRIANQMPSASGGAAYGSGVV